MNEEEKDVVKSFEGEKSYKETCSNSAYYLNNNSNMLPQIEMK